MSNTATYKDWLFVTVPEDIAEIEISFSGEKIVFWHKDGFFYEQELIGSYQIIGKGDEIDWEGIIAPADIADPRGHQVTAKESGYSVVRSYGMEPSTTLVLKKQTKLK